jgi:S-adenosylmethionine-diacylgycerolhomoserine-N-methlytransferase
MIPDWFAVLENAMAMLKPGGLIGVVDFYVSRKHPAEGMVRHPWLTRAFWPLWFGTDGVVLSADHIPFLHRRFRTVLFRELRGRVPYLPLGREPYYIFVGR